jgi:hypothetical protein
MIHLEGATMARKQKQQPSERQPNQDAERDRGLGGDSQTEIPGAQPGVRMPEKNNRGDSEQEVPSEEEQSEEERPEQRDQDERDEPEK